MGKRAKLSARSRTLLTGALVLATAALWQVPAHAAPPAPTSVDTAVANDGWINIAESTQVVVTGTYPDASGITEIRVRIRHDGSCDPNTITTSNSIGPFKIPTDGGTFGGGSFESMPIDVSGLTDGATLCALAHSRDAAVTPSTWTADNNSAVLDLTAPTATVTLNDGDGIVGSTEASTSVPISWSVSGMGPLVTVQARNTGDAAPSACVYNNQPRGPVTGAITAACFAALDEGLLTLEVIGSDLAGNPATGTDTSILDLGPPVPSVSISPTLITLANQNAVTVTVGANESDVVGTVSVDDTNGATPALVQPFDLSAGPAALVFDVASLSDGTITATVSMTDAAANNVVASVTATKDSTPPAPPVIITPIENAVVPAHFDIAGTAEAGSLVEVFDVTDPEVVRVGQASVPAGGNWSVKAFVSENGPRQFRAKATDGVGNASALSAIRTLDVDAAAPTVLIELPANNSLYLPTDPVVIEGTTRDSGSGILGLDVKVFTFGQEVQSAELKTTNGGLVCTSGCPTKVSSGRWTFRPNVGTGYFTVKIWAIDIAGNRTPQPAEVNFLKIG